MHRVLAKERASQSKALALQSQLSRAKTEQSQLQRSKEEVRHCVSSIAIQQWRNVTKYNYLTTVHK